MNPQKKYWLLAALLFFSLLPSLAFAHKAYDGIVVFGDSLSDPGNAYYLLGRALTPPYETLDELLIPDAPYAIGGHHFSNGPTWIEQFARSLGLKRTVGPAYTNGMHSHQKRTNYAVGSARARDNGSGIDLTDQVDLYLSQGVANPSAESTLYVIAIGGNDVRDALAALAQDPSGVTSTEIIDAALTSISNNIITLYATAGAMKFLISNAADLSLTPAVQILDVISPGSAVAAAALSVEFNAGLDLLIDQLQKQLPGVSMTKFDFFNLLHEVVADPDRYHLTDVTDACVMPGIPPYHCSQPDRNLFWDGIHPTRSGHAIFAGFARDALFPDRLTGRKHVPRGTKGAIPKVAALPRPD